MYDPKFVKIEQSDVKKTGLNKNGINKKIFLWSKLAQKINSEVGILKKSFVGVTSSKI